LEFVKLVQKSRPLKGTQSHNYGVSLAIWDLPPNTSEHTPF